MASSGQPLGGSHGAGRQARWIRFPTLNHERCKMHTDNHTKPVLLRIDKVLALTGLGRSTLYRLMGKGYFPPPRKIGKHTIAWRTDEIEDWLNNLPKSR